MGHWKAVKCRKGFNCSRGNLLLMAQKMGIVHFKQEKMERNKRKPKNKIKWSKIKK